jgi:hypothetical protein
MNAKDGPMFQVILCRTPFACPKAAKAEGKTQTTRSPTQAETAWGRLDWARSVQFGDLPSHVLADLGREAIMEARINPGQPMPSKDRSKGLGWLPFSFQGKPWQHSWRGGP